MSAFYHYSIHCAAVAIIACMYSMRRRRWPGPVRCCGCCRCCCCPDGNHLGHRDDHTHTCMYIVTRDKRGESTQSAGAQQIRSSRERIVSLPLYPTQRFLLYATIVYSVCVYCTCVYLTHTRVRARAANPLSRERILATLFFPFFFSFSRDDSIYSFP